MPGSVLAAATQALGALAAVDLRALGGAELRQFVLGVDGLRRRLAAIEASGLDAFDASVEWALDGAYNPANWLTVHTGTSRADAGSRLRFAKVLRRMPDARQALAGGAISETHVRLLARCDTPRTRDVFAEHEAFLVEKAREFDADQFAAVAQVWLEHADPDGVEPADESDTFHLSRTLGGRLKGSFDLGPELAAPVEAAINEKVQELFHRDRRNTDIDFTDPSARRPPANRRAHALAELVTQGAASPQNPARRKPAFNVNIDLPTFAGEDAGLDAFHVLDNGKVVPLHLVDLWRCDSEAARVLLSAEGAVLDLGRSQRTASDDQRRALAARDRGCAVPGCDRPASWCDAHHVQWWERDGGLTDIGNLVLLCRHHHRRIHRGHLTVRMVDGVPKFWVANGLQLPMPSPPGDPPDVRAA